MFKEFMKIKRLDKIQKLSLVLIAVVLLCTLLDVTVAWYTSRDSVNNHFSGKDYYVNIMLTEPNWDSVGNKQAAAMQPGMDIFKDPRVINIAADSCYVRMQIQILDKDGNQISKTDTDTFNRYNAIRNAIMYYKGVGEDGEEVFSEYNKDEFTYYDDGWYYYTNGSDMVAELKGFEKTGALFTDVKIPVLKTEYAHFAEGFTINVIAEAVYSINGSISLEECAARFEGKTLSNSETDTLSVSEDESNESDAADTAAEPEAVPNATEQPEITKSPAETEAPEAPEATEEAVASSEPEATEDNKESIKGADSEELKNLIDLIEDLEDASNKSENSEETEIIEDTEESEVFQEIDVDEDIEQAQETQKTQEIRVVEDEPVVVSTSSSGDFTDADSAEEVE